MCRAGRTRALPARPLSSSVPLPWEEKTVRPAAHSPVSAVTACACQASAEKQKETYVEESPWTVTETWPVRDPKASQQAGHRGLSPGRRLAEFLPLAGSRLGCSEDFNGLGAAHHALEDKPLYSASTRGNVNLLQKLPHGNVQNNVRPSVWAPWCSQADSRMSILYKWGTSRSNVRQAISGLFSPQNYLLIRTFVFHATFLTLIIKSLE